MKIIRQSVFYLGHIHIKIQRLDIYFGGHYRRHPQVSQHKRPLHNVLFHLFHLSGIRAILD